MSWDLPESIEINGTIYPVRTGYRAILDILSAIADPELDNEEKSAAVLSVFYPDVDMIPKECWREAIEKCFWFINCGDEQQDSRKAARLVNWEQDFGLIAPPVNRILGIEIRKSDGPEDFGIHWWTFIGGYYEIGDCTFAQVIRIRDKLARGRALDKQERVWYRQNQHLVEFKNKYTEAEKNILRELSGM